MTLGQRIIQAREAMDPPLSTADLARASGVPYPTLKGIEDEHQKSSTQLPALAAALGVNATWLQNGKGPRKGSGPPRDAQVLDDDIRALRLGLAAIASSMVVHRPVEARDAAAALRTEAPPPFLREGFLSELVAILDRAAPEAGAKHRSGRKSASSAR